MTGPAIDCTPKKLVTQRLGDSESNWKNGFKHRHNYSHLYAFRSHNLQVFSRRSGANTSINLIREHTILMHWPPSGSCAYAALPKASSNIFTVSFGFLVAIFSPRIFALVVVFLPPYLRTSSSIPHMKLFVCAHLLHQIRFIILQQSLGISSESSRRLMITA